MDTNTVSVMTPIIQMGFAGFCVILISLIFWMIRDNRSTQREQVKQLIEIISKNTDVIAANTATINSLIERSDDELKLLRTIHDKLNYRPCIAKGE